MMLIKGMKKMTQITKVQFSSVAQWCSTPCDPMNHSTPSLPVHYQLPEFTQPVIYLGPNYGESNEDNGDILQKVPCRH